MFCYSLTDAELQHLGVVALGDRWNTSETVRTDRRKREEDRDESQAGCSYVVGDRQAHQPKLISEIKTQRNVL